MTKKRVIILENKNNNIDELEEVLYKKALGYEVEEVSEEFAVNKENNELELIKRKVNKKQVLPDMTAVKTLLDLLNKKQLNFKNMTDEELEKEKIKLLKMLKEE